MASVKFPTFPSIDFSKLDMSQFKVPQFDVSQFDMPNIKLPQVNTEAVTNAAKDAGYITVGLAVLALQKAQVRRKEFRKSLTDQVGNGKSQLAEIVDAVEAGLAKIDTKLVEIETKVDDAVVGLEKRLPSKASAALTQAHEVVKTVRKQARTLLTPAA
jgi:hypothetical protein